MTTQSPEQAGEIKPLIADDLQPVIEIDRKISGTTRKGFFEKRLAAALEHPGDYIYVGLHQGGKLCGYAMAKLVSGEFGQPGARASLDALGVDPDYQGKGAGHQLLKGVEDILNHKGVGELTSQVDWTQYTMLGFFSEAGFDLAPRIVLARDTSAISIDEVKDYDRVDDAGDADYSSPIGDDPAALSTDRIPVRSMKKSDLEAIISIDRKTSRNNRSTYFKRKQDEVLNQSGIRVSIVAELDGFVVGFIMARVDYGEFGHTSTEAVMDTIGVNPDYQGQGIGQALMSRLVANLVILQVDPVRPEFEWNNTGLISYLNRLGFAPTQTVVLTRKL